MNSKPFIASRTIWLNAATTLVAIGTAISSQPWIADHPHIASALAATVAVANIVLRFLTDRPVE